MGSRFRDCFDEGLTVGAGYAGSGWHDAVVATDDSTSLKRRLGLAGATAIGVGAMLGTGVFAAWTPALRLAGPLLLLSLVVAAVVAALNAWSTASLARLHPEAGGVYVYGRARLGRSFGVVAGWAFVIGKVASAGAAALTIGTYISPSHARIIGLVAVVLVLLLDLWGVTRTAAVSAILSVAVIAVLASLVGGVVGADTALPSSATGVQPGVAGVLGGAALLFVAFAGYARIATLGEEVREPATTLPRAIALSFTVVLVVYFAIGACVIAVLGQLPLNVLSPAPLEQIASIVQGPGLSAAVRVAAVLAAGGALLSLLAGVGRTLFAMGRAGDAPEKLSAVSRHGVPHRAQLLAAVGAAAVVLAGGIAGALALSAASILAYYGIAHLAALRLDADERRPPRVVPVAGLIGCIALTVSLVVVVGQLN